MTIVCAGDCGVDNYTDLHILKPGGISLNVSVHARKLFSKSHKIEVIGCLGNDKSAVLVKNTLKNNNILNYLQDVPGSTPTQYIATSLEGEKIFTTYDEGVLHNFAINDFQITLIDESDLVIAPLFNQIEPFFKSVITIKKKGLTCVDFLDLSDYKKKIDVVKKYVNYFDLAFFGLHAVEKELINSLAQLSNNSDKLFVITLGKDGSMAFFKGQSVFAKAKKINKVVDTTGAGDAFAAAFLNEYLASNDISKSLKAGNKYASKVVQHVGGF